MTTIVRLLALFVLCLSLGAAGTPLLAQSLPPLDFSVWDGWKNVENPKLSPDGNWACFELNPQEGDGALVVADLRSGEARQFARGVRAEFSPGSTFLAFAIAQPLDTLRRLRRAGTEDEDLPHDSLGVLVLATGALEKLPEIKAFALPRDQGEWLAALAHKAKDPEPEDSTAGQWEKNHSKGGVLTLWQPGASARSSFEGVTEMAFSHNGRLLAFLQSQNDTLDKAAAFAFATQDGQLRRVMADTARGWAKHLAVNEQGTEMAFLRSADTLERKTFALWHFRLGQDQARLLVDTLSPGMAQGMAVSEHAAPFFSPSGNRLFFQMAPRPEPEPKDTLLDEERVTLDIWSWNDPRLQPEQLVNLDEERARGYLALHDFRQAKTIALASPSMASVRLGLDGDSDWALGFDDGPYLIERTWEYPWAEDVYLVSLADGSRKLLRKRLAHGAWLSPQGRFFAWYEAADSAFWCLDTRSFEAREVSRGVDEALYPIENDNPVIPEPWGVAGWTRGDERLLVHGQLHLWELDPTGQRPARKLSQQAPEGVRARLVELDPLAHDFDPRQRFMLRLFDTRDKRSGYAWLDPASGRLEVLALEPFLYDGLRKARGADRFLWTRQDFQTFPDLWASGGDFAQPRRLSHANPQQQDYNWGTVELVSWHNPLGFSNPGLLYKPQDYDPARRYPAIVYFYETHTDELHRHYAPKPSRSVIDPTFYASNGYLVIMPDVRYQEGRPGHGALMAATSAAGFLVEQGLADPARLGIQGQSWGGYQVAYVITQTDIFAAASAGAPVSNMTSAYGGIRWESGLSRAFQYEHGQSRIGGTLWERPWRYIENSPVFHAPNVSTPLLMRHNDADGAVPWEQGIEFYIALRRLAKPVWLLNYNGQPHNQSRRADSKDLSIRMFQFFEHYLKGQEAPRWMVEGVPALRKGRDMGYEQPARP